MKLALVVDDDDALRRVLEIHLTCFGLAVECAGTGLEAVSMAINKSYRLIIMDVHLPGMNGLEAILLIRKHERETARPKAIIVILSADDLSNPIIRSIDADHYIRKPNYQEPLEQILSSIHWCY